MDKQTVEWIRQQLRHDPRLRGLPQLAQADAEGDILTTVYLRYIKNRRKISSRYIAKTVLFHLKPRRRGDPYVEKLRRLADERQRKGLPTEASLLENRPAVPEPIDELIEREDQQLARERLQRIHVERQQLGARPWAVIEKFLSGTLLTQPERSVYYLL